jgi:predicted RNA-binding Zn-ribbon protein involved in translation (DUF1610 family)
MTECRHYKLVLLPREESRLQCEHCHLTIKPHELGEDYCPECFETFGKKQYDFKEIPVVETEISKYRCEDCGILIEH